MSAVVEQISDAEEIRVDVRLTPEMRREVTQLGALAVAQDYDVDCPEVAQALADERRGWAQRLDRMEAMEKEALSPAKKMLADMKAWAERWFGPAKADLTAARDLAGEKLLEWDKREKARIAEENAKREAEARRLRQEAEQRAAAERAKAEEAAREARRKAQEAETARLKAEAEGNARAAAAAAAAAAKAVEAARAAIENGEARAQRAQLQATAHVFAMPQAGAVKIEGQTLKDNWAAELKPGVTMDQAKKDIAVAIAAGGNDFLLPLIEINMAARGPLNKLAAALMDKMNVPGFRAVNKQTLAGSRK